MTNEAEASESMQEEDKSATGSSSAEGSAMFVSDTPIDEKIIQDSQLQLKCLVCGKESRSRGYIYNHVLRHGPPRLRCGYCPATMYFPTEAK